MPTDHDGRTTATRQHILREAEQLYAIGGYEHINLQEIANHLGITKAAVFHHFKNKEGLFFEMLTKMLREMQHLFARAVKEGAADIRSRLLRLFSVFYEMPPFDIMRFQQDEFHRLEPDHQQRIAEVWVAGPWSVISDVFTEGIASGELRPHRIDIAIQLFFASCMLLPLLKNDGAAPDPAALESIVDIMLNGLRSG